MEWHLVTPEEMRDTGNVPLSQIAIIYPFPDRMMFQLAPSVDVERNITDQLIIFYMCLAMNTEHADYKSFGNADTMAGLETEIKSVVASVLENYSEEDCRNDYDQIEAEILSAIQKIFQSDFIYKVSISDVVYQ